MVTFDSLTFDPGDEPEGEDNGVIDSVFGVITDTAEQAIRTIGQASSERAAREINGVADKIRNPNNGTPPQTQVSLGNRFKNAVSSNTSKNVLLFAGGVGIAVVAVSLLRK